MAEENSKYFKLKIITPNRLFYEGEAEMVEFNTTEGEMGVYKHHIPMTVILKPGVLTITGEDVKKAALHSGFVEITGDSVTILAEIIEWPDEIDGDRANAAMERAQDRLSKKDSETDIARAETALLRAVARINTIK